MYRELEAYRAAERIVNSIVSAGFDLADTESIIMNSYNLPDEIQFAYGASRIVFWDVDYCDYVIKVPRHRNYERYCQHEVEVYNAACEEGLSDCFAWCAQYAESDYDNDVPGIYVMEFLYCNEDEVYDSPWTRSYKEYCDERGLDSSNYDAADDFDEWCYDEESSMILECIEAGMTQEKRRAFSIFMTKWMINDIHRGNAALDDNDHMVLTDYAGWGW